MKSGFAALAVVGVVAAAAVFMASEKISSGMNLTYSDYAFSKYMTKYGKSYATKSEYAFRKALFDQSQTEASLFNAQNDKSWHMAVNKFSDMTP